MLSFHQSSRGGHEYTKGKAETGCLPQLYLAQLYRHSFLLLASTFFFHPPTPLFFLFQSKGCSPTKAPGLIKVGHAYWTSQVDCKCKLNVDTKCHLSFASLALGGKDSVGSAPRLLFLPCSTVPCTGVVLLTQTLEPSGGLGGPSPALLGSLSHCEQPRLPLSLPQLSDRGSELAF